MRVLTIAEAAAVAASRRQAGRRVVFTNGVFDLLHPGHVRYLAAARNDDPTRFMPCNKRIFLNT